MRSYLLAAAAMLCAAPAIADVKAGVDAWGRGDFRRAVEEWRGPAIAGDADAQFNLGQAYKLGRGVPVDPALAESWFRKAAQQGHEQAGDNYALALFQAGRKSEAVPWLEKSVARDEPRTELVYGTMLFNGDGVSRDYPRAYALMTRAAAPRLGTDGLTSARETLQQMDGFIAPADRERGVALAQRYALAAESRPVAATGPTRVAEQAPASRLIADERPARAPEPVKVSATQPATPMPVQAIAARPTPRAKVATVPKRAPAGAWKVQLGAFRTRGNAEALWNRVGPSLASAAPAYVAGGGFTRLQATGYPNRAAAQRACRVTGVSCVVVAP